MQILKIIRQLGDDILHRPPVAVDFTNLQWDLHAIAKIMLDDLNVTGGVGIAANQCKAIATPPQMIIVGVNNSDALAKAQKRYPNEDIPEPVIMVNPKIVDLSAETYYPQAESCLSMYGNVRARVKRHRRVVVLYQDVDGKQHKKKLEGMAAHILQHEIDHLQGVEFIRHALAELKADDLQSLLDTVNEISVAVDHQYDPSKVEPTPSFDRNASGAIVVNWEVVRLNLPTLTAPALQGFAEMIARELELRLR